MGGRGGSSYVSKRNAEDVLSAMRDAGFKPVKSVAETQEILQRHRGIKTNSQKTIDKFWNQAGFGMESKNVTINKVEGSKVHFTYMGQSDVFETDKRKKKS